MRVMLLLAANISAVALSVLQAQPPAEMQFPAEYRDGLIWVKVRPADSAEPLNFLLDSGAAVSVIDQHTAQQLGFRLGERAVVRGVNTRTSAHWTPPATVRVGDLTWRQKFLAVDLHKLAPACHRPVDGLLGADFFKGRVIQIDFAGNTVRILPAAPVAGSGDVIPLRTQRGVFLVPIRVNEGQPRWARLDTGCAKALQWVTTAMPAGGADRQISIGLAAVSVPTVPTRVQIGTERFEALPTGLYAQEIFAGEAGLVGNGLLSQFKVTVDAVGGRVVLEKRY